MKKSIVILIDDTVFMQHILGLIFILNEQNFKPYVYLSDQVDIEITASQILEALHKQKQVLLVKVNERAKVPKLNFDTVVTQWGAPKTLFRNAKNAHNKLLHRLNLEFDEIYAFPHGFEIKEQSLSITNRTIVRSLLTDLSKNPFSDYNSFFSKYFFESRKHSKRYENYLDPETNHVIGLVSFNQFSLRLIKDYIQDGNISRTRYRERVLIMPKLRHINAFGIDLNSFEGTIVLHPREIEQQNAMLDGIGNKCERKNCLDFFALSAENVVLDFGTSVSLLAKQFSAEVVFENHLKTDLIYDPSQTEKLNDTFFFSAGKKSLEEYKNYVCSEMNLNHA